MEKIVIRLNTNSLALQGIDQSLLANDISFEINNYSKEANGTVTRKEIPAPEEAQGEGIIEWIIDQLQDPHMAKVYARFLIS